MTRTMRTTRRIMNSLPRPRRILVNVAVLISLLLNGVAVLEWIRSQYHCDVAIIGLGGYRDVAISFVVGGIQFVEEVYPLPDLYVAGWRSVGPYPPLSQRSIFGFSALTAHAQTSDSVKYSLAIVVLPNWFVVGLTLILPLWWLVTSRGRRRRRFSHCTVCGYDLRASSVRCPECGTERDTVPVPKLKS